MELALHNIENIMKALSNAYRKLDEVSLAMVYTKRSCRLASQSFEKRKTRNRRDEYMRNKDFKNRKHINGGILLSE